MIPLSSATDTGPNEHRVGASGDELVAALATLGIRFLSRGVVPGPPSVTGEALVTGLAMSDEARLRTALIPLFLWKPEYSAVVPGVAKELSGEARATLECYYSAAVVLQGLHRRRLLELGAAQQLLPDLFATATRPGNADARLLAVAERHAVLTGERINWLGTYHHAAGNLLRSLELVQA